MVLETVLETARLRLTNWLPEHVDDLVALHGDPVVTRYLTTDGQPETRERAEQRLAHWANDFASQRMGKLRVIRKEDGVFVGRAGFGIYAATGEPEIGFALFRQHWGKGYAVEAASGLRDWIFRETDRLHFIGFAHRDNAASLSVLKRIGMRPTDTRVVFDMPCQFYACDRPAA